LIITFGRAKYLALTSFRVKRARRNTAEANAGSSFITSTIETVQRSSELAVLSREHHVALELALRLQRATAADAETVTEATLDFWRSEGREHFRLEEELLLPAFARHAGADDADIVRVLVEHVEIRRRIADMETSGRIDVAALNALGKSLRDHVRHEERTLFGRIEQALEPEELATLGTTLHAIGARHQPPRT
jgi:hemerythrin-like domain-containing protein